MKENTPTDLKQVFRRHRLKLDFPPEVEREVKKLVADPGIDDPALADMSHLPFITIDNADSRDLDQALHIQREGAGFVVHYALADAAHYVRAGGPIFAEALKRGASYYLPGLCVPMLPRQLSEDLVSLNPAVERRALVFCLHLSADGHSESTEIVRARILSRAKLTYDGVQAFFDEPPKSPLAEQVYTPSLTLLAQVGRLRLAEARARDVVQYNRADVEVERGTDGAGFEVISRNRNDVSMWNEQISLLCNSEGARLLAKRGGESDASQPVYRVHAAPEPRSLKRLVKVIARLVELHGLDPATWVWRRGAESLADYLARLPDGGERAPVGAAIERQVLLTNQRSVYSAEPSMHYALGVTPYSRFSSPMREVVGVFTHKEALEKLGILPVAVSAAEDEELRERIIQAANQAKQLQRNISKDVTKLAVDQLLQGDLELPEAERPQRAGTVLGLSPSRIYVRLDEPQVDLKIYLDDLQARTQLSFTLQADEVSLATDGDDPQRIRIGDRLRLTTASYEDRRGRWHLLPVL